MLILFDLSFFASKAQTPQATSYQAIIRNSSGILVSNRLVSLRFSIRDSIASGQIVYREIHNPITTTQGMVNLNVGNGTPISGSFSAINWGSKRKFLQVELDVNGGTAFTDLGTQQLLSVPYALYANKAAKADTALYSANSMPAGNASGDMLFWNGTSWINLPAGGYGQLLAMCDGVPSWGGCPPKITTNTTTSVTYASATSGGSINTDGGQPVTTRGVCWSTTPNPTIALATKTVNGSGTGSFSSTINDLTPNTTYYVRAYATNSIGTSYGNEITFTTPTCPPSNNTNIGALAGSFNNTNDDFGGSLYGPYATNVSSFSNTTATTGSITVDNIFDNGWAPITFKLDWTDPNNLTVTLDQQENIAPGSTVGVDDTYQVMVRAFAGENGTYSVCNQTIQLKMQVGVLNASGAGGWSSSLYTVNLAR